MKKIFLLLMLLSAATGSFCQSIQISNDTVNIVGNGSSEIVGSTVLKNMTPLPITINWTENFTTTPPGDWTFSVCDPINCFPPTTTSDSFSIGGNDTGSMHLDVTPDNQSGYSVVTLNLSFRPNQSASIVFIVNVTATGINPVSLKNKIVIAPDPVLNYLNFLLPKNYIPESINVFDFLGKRVKTIVDNHVAGISAINVAGLKPGFYLLQLRNSSGQIITQTFEKN